MSWATTLLLGIAALAFLGLGGMLLYRQRHKTNVEVDMLIKQLRLNSRMRTALHVQQDWIAELRAYCEQMAEEWSVLRVDIMRREQRDIGVLPKPPAPSMDVDAMFQDIEF